MLKIQASGWGVSLRNISFWDAGLHDIEGTRELQFVEEKLPKGTSMVLPGYLDMVGTRRAELGGLWVSGSGRVPYNLAARQLSWLLNLRRSIMPSSPVKPLVQTVLLATSMQLVGGV